MDPVEGRVEAHLRRGRDDRADDGADEGDDGEHEDEDPGAALEGTAAAIGIGAPHAKFAFGVPGLRYELRGQHPPPSLYPFVKQLVKRETDAVRKRL